ncbi:MAG: hypothetical protein PHW31_03825 [Candidatus Pacebacteria bacterium]|nr:hypothetical protein [Candidatus Paceibacterota bacterium]
MATVVAEVETDVTCPKCGRVFQIPNAPQYTRAFLHSVRSTSVARLGFRFGIERLFNTVLDEGTEETQWRIPEPINVNDRETPKIRAPEELLFPEHGEPYASQEENWYWVIAEYSGHSSLDQIQRIVIGETLAIESLLPDCPYSDIVKGLGVFTKIFEENFQNGILEIKLKE